MGIALLCLVFQGVYAVTIAVTPTTASVKPGASVTFDLILDTASAGLSGYNITTLVNTPVVGEITAVSFPSWAMLAENSTVPSSRVWCRAVDFTGASGKQNIKLCSITVKGRSSGTTTIGVDPQVVEDREGGQYTPEVIPATLLVEGGGKTPFITSLSPSSAVAASPAFTLTVDGHNFISGSVARWDGADRKTTFLSSTRLTAEIPASDIALAGSHSVTVFNPGLDGGLSNAVTFIVTSTPIPPRADFTADTTVGMAPLDVLFTDLSTGSPSAWAWEFGDGGTDQGQNPLHTYTKVGNYSVSLKVSNSIGSDEKTRPQYITVTETPPPAPIAQFTADPVSGKAPLSVLFIDKSTGVVSGWAWEFGDEGAATEQNPVHVYKQVGQYTVTLTAKGPGGSDRIEKKNLITVTPPVPVSTQIDLAKGWNLVSVPYFLKIGNNTAAIFEGVDMARHSILMYNTTGRSWARVESRYILRPFDAYWVYAAEPARIPLEFFSGDPPAGYKTTLLLGWNVVGYTQMIPRSANATFSQVGTKWLYAFDYNAGAQAYEPIVINGGTGMNSDERLFYPTKAYWVYMREEGDLKPG